MKRRENDESEEEGGGMTTTSRKQTQQIMNDMQQKFAKIQGNIDKIREFGMSNAKEI